MATCHIDLDSSTDDALLFQGLADGADRVSVFSDRARARAWLLEG